MQGEFSLFSNEWGGVLQMYVEYEETIGQQKAICLGFLVSEVVSTLLASQAWDVTQERRRNERDQDRHWR